MRALILQGLGSLGIEDRPMPEPGPGELLIKVKAATTCGTDLKALLRGHPHIPCPGPFGHEYSGVVERAGVGAPFMEGDEVMGVHSAPCGHCQACMRGQENLCESIMKSMVLGSYAEFLLVPRRIASANVFVKPPEVPFEVASLLEPLSCVAQGMLELERTSASPFERVLVIGPGAIGLMFVGALKLAGVPEVTLAGRNPARLSVGARMGARTAPWPDGAKAGLYDVVIECTGQPEVWERSITFARRGGVVMLFGGCRAGTTVTFDTGRIHYDQISFISPFHFGRLAVRRAREWLIANPSAFEPLISGVRTLDEADETFADLQAGRGLKFAFRP